MGTEELIIIEVFCQEYQIETNFIQDLEEYGLITTTIHEEKKYLNTNQLVYIEKIIRLHNDLNINKEGIDVILQLQEKEEQLLKEIKNLKNRLGLYE
jgi:chaperone modulatory protein CbpM